jgi:pSer/pThr/pTyr-binding forkhead associated (FHA) protein
MNIGALVFIFAIIAFLILRGFLVHEQRRQKAGKKTKANQAPEEVITTKEHDVPPPESQEKPVVTAEPEPRPPKMAQVGGYYFPAPEPRQPTALLIGLSGPVEGRQFAIEKETFHIGASQENDLNIAEDEHISQNHAFIRYQRGSLFIFDKGSRNGTFVNQNIVSDTGFELRFGDTIRVGVSVFELTKTGEVSHFAKRTKKRRINYHPPRTFAT